MLRQHALWTAIILVVLSSCSAALGQQTNAPEKQEPLPKLTVKQLRDIREELVSSAEKEKKRDGWDIANIIVGWAAVLIIPAVVGLVGIMIRIALKNRETHTKMLELAIKLLNVDPKVVKQDEKLRKWAIQVIDTYSEVKLPEEVQVELQSRPLEEPSRALEGSATHPLAKALNRLKNRTATPTESDIDKSATLAALLAPGNDRERWNEKRAARVTGFVTSVKFGKLTSANFRSRRHVDRDTEIRLALQENAPPNHQVIAIVTPRIRAAMQEKGVDWSTKALADPQKGILGKWIELTGWLLCNFTQVREAMNTHPGNPRSSRATCWEIHPVTSIKVVGRPAAI